MRTCTLCLTLALLATACGCQTFDLAETAWPWGKSKEEKARQSAYVNPSRMVAIWTDTVRYTSGGHPTRGFGGRLYFYNERGQAVPVEGQLAVFAFDDTNVAPGTAPPNRPPDRRFAFTKEQFTKHFSESDLGASYSIWIPWDPAGGEQRHITLVPMFTTNDGSVITGAQTANVLPGKSATESAPAQDQGIVQGGVYEGQSVAYETAEIVRKGLMKTATISVPRNGAIAPPTSRATALQVAAPLPDALPAGVHGSLSGALTATSSGPTQHPQAGSQRLPVPEAEGSLGVNPVGGPATRFERPRSRALGAPISRLGRDHSLTRQIPPAPPSNLPSSLSPGQ